MSLAMIFADRFLGRFDHGIHAVPFVVGVVQVKLLRAIGALHGDLGGRRRLYGSSGKGDHDETKIAYSLFIRYAN